MNGDRFMPGNKTMMMPFMGKTAEFPVSPFYMAAKMKVPAVYVFAMKESKYHYHFYATPPREIKGFESIKNREKIMKDVLSEYVSNLEHMVKKYPLQWFNYYPFWKN